MQTDFLIVGCGLYGAVMSNRIREAGYACRIIERRHHLAGNCYTETIDGIQVHRYGAHIFHTNDEYVWNYVGRFARFNGFINSPIANYHGEIYNLPFNMNTFHRMWGVVTPAQAQRKIEQQRQGGYCESPSNLEEQAISLVGKDIYHKLIRGYTEKQWGRPCNQLSPSIILRLPVRLTYDNNYYDAQYQGIPVEGYTRMVEQMIGDTPVEIGMDYLSHRDELEPTARCIIFTGPIDEYFAYCYGPLSYRSLQFQTQRMDVSNYQGNAVVNYTDVETPFTRVIEHKHFLFGRQPHTIITREYSAAWKPGDEPYYPITDLSDNKKLARYRGLAKAEHKVFFGGRLGEFRYYDMDKIVALALERSTPKALAEMLTGRKQRQ